MAVRKEAKEREEARAKSCSLPLLSHTNALLVHLVGCFLFSTCCNAYENAATVVFLHQPSSVGGSESEKVAT